MVLPVVLVLEWFARAARAALPGLGLEAVRDLRVLRGVRLPRFDAAPETFLVLCRALPAEGTVELELRGADGTLHYSATAELTAGGAPAPAAGGAPQLPPWGDRPVYGGALFHGQALQVVEHVDGVSRDGLSAGLTGLAGGSGRAGRGGPTPPPSMGLSSWRCCGPSTSSGSPPCRPESPRSGCGPTGPSASCAGSCPGAPPRGSGRCATCALIAADGRLAAELHGVETHLLPGD